MTPLDATLLAEIDAARDELVAFFQGFSRIATPNPPGETREAAVRYRRAAEAARARYARARTHYELKEFEAACDDFHEAQNLGLADVSDEYGLSFCRK